MQFPPGTDPRENQLNQRVIEVARAHNAQVYIVGGYIRDALLSRKVNAKDIDYAITGITAADFADEISIALDGHYVPLDETFDTARVALKSGEILDFAGCVGGTIHADLGRRDFSINAMAWDPSDPEKIIDLHGGMADLRDLRIRAVSEQSIIDDPLRVLRAFRFAATIGGTIDDTTLGYVRKHAHELANVAAERINHELFTTLAVHKTAPLVEMMAQTGVLEAIFPELTPTREVTKNDFHHLGLFDHSVETNPQLEQVMETLPDWVQERFDIQLNVGLTRLATTKIAALLHDIGKPQTWAITPEGRHTFYTHDKLGAEMCKDIGARLKWTRPVDRLVYNLVRWHLRPGALFHQGTPTNKAIARFYRSIGDDTPELIVLAFADFGATRGPGLSGENRTEGERNLYELLDGYKTYVEESKTREKLLNGTDLMELLSLQPGPIVGEILAALDEAHEFKEVSNRADAERFVKEHYSQKYSK